VIATQHRKEDVVAPLLRNRLSMVPLPAQNLNTDALGTFSGEIPRLLDPIMAMRRKCQLALDWVDADFAFASEGSFGPHPHIPFSACNDEMVMLYEAATGRHWIAREMTAQTNFNASEINTWKTLSPMPTARFSMGVAVIDDRFIWTFGGTNNRWQSLDVIEVFDIKNNMWSTLPIKLTAPQCGTRAVAIDHKIYILGGGAKDNPHFWKLVEAIDTDTMTWSTIHTTERQHRCVKKSARWDDFV
jgi:hypothetical protein